MKRSLVSVVMIIAVMALVSSCGSSKKTAAEETTTITVLCEGHPSSTAYDQVKGEFEELTGIKVNLEIIPYEELPQKVLLGFSQKSTDYDIVMNDRLFIQGYITNDYITPLDEFINNSELNQYWDETDFVPSYLKAVQFNGKTYGFPVYGESTFLMYRKDLFQEYGINVPTTMTELEAAARTIKEKSNGSVAGITLRGQQGIHAVYTWGAFLWGYGGRYFDEGGRLVVDSPEAIRGTQMYVDLLNKYGPVGYANFGWQENRLLFQQGKAGMTIDATVNGAYCEDPKESDIVGKVGYAAVPTEVTNGYGGTASLAVHGFYINNAISQKQKEAAFLFGSWATSAAVQEKTISVEAHSGLTSIAAMQSVAFREKYGSFSDGMISVLNAANVDYLPTIPEANEIINRVGTALSQALAGSRNAEQALKAVCEDVNANVLKK
jgi:ABC-type glycerol-3-phosphate transport system substrate-binding protein